MYKGAIDIDINKKGFTLLELIIVIVIVGVLAAMGFIQYNKVVENSRLVEARVQIGNMRKLAYEYYLKYGSPAGIQESDIGVDGNCHPDSFYNYWIRARFPTCLDLAAARCTEASGGKKAPVDRGYIFYLHFCPDTGQSEWHCYYADSSSCFGLPP